MQEARKSPISSSHDKDSYHSYQQVWLMMEKGQNKEMVFKKQRKKSVKTKTGCLNCKRRRKKCDEQKPTCKGCVRNELVCSWPDHIVNSISIDEIGRLAANSDPVPSDQQRTISSTSQKDNGSEEGNYTKFIREYSELTTENNQQIPESSLQQTTTNIPIVAVQEPPLALLNPSSADMDNINTLFSMEEFIDGFTMDTDMFNTDLTNSNYLLDQFLFIQQENNTKPSPAVSSNHSTDTQSTMNSMNEYEQSILDNKLYDIPGLKMTQYDKVCYSHFVDKFLLSITPPHCNQLISPIKILLPYLVTHKTVREIFLACGASFHAFKNDRYIKRANERYTNCVNLLIREIQNSKDGAEDHLFICAQLLQTLCLRDKTIGANATKCAAHLSASYEIIKKRFIKNSTNLQNFDMTPLDRILSEHFIFNYPITVLLCHSDRLFEKIIPSPFQFFEQFNDILTQPFDPENDDPFLNHPVLGVSLKANEIASKLSWICRFFRKSMEVVADKTTLWNRYRDISVLLRHETEQNLKDLEKLFQTPGLSDDQRLNISITKIALYADMMILKKLCNELQHSPSEKIKDLKLEEECQAIVSEIKYSYTKCPDPFLDGWAIFVCGLLTKDLKIQKLIEECYIANASEVNSSLCLKILKFLKVFWLDDATDGFEVLFDTTTLDIICM